MSAPYIPSLYTKYEAEIFYGYCEKQDFQNKKMLWLLLVQVLEKLGYFGGGQHLVTVGVTRE